MAISNEPGFTFTDVDEHPQQSTADLKYPAVFSDQNGVKKTGHSN
jgi:hypothetical protein